MTVLSDTLLVVGSAQAEFAAQFAHEHGLKVHLLTGRPSAALLRAADQVTVLTPADLLDCRPLAARLAKSSPAGIVSLDQHRVTLAARLAELLELGRCPSVTAALACEDKRETARRLLDAGVAHPRTLVVLNEDEAVQVVDELGGVAVVKPANDSGSRHVRLVRTPEAVRAAVAAILHGGSNFAGDALARAVLLQEYVRGPEFSVEVEVNGGSPRALMVTAKRLGEPPLFVECGHVVPAPVPASVRAQLAEQGERTVRAVGLDYAVAHVEMRLDPVRGPVTIELGARPGGDCIPELVAHTTGHDLRAVACQIALGLPRLPVREPSAGGAAIRYLLAATEGYLHIGGPNSAAGLPGVVRVGWEAKPGDRVGSTADNGSRLGYVLAIGPDGESAERRARDAIEALGVEVRPAAACRCGST